MFVGVVYGGSTGHSGVVLTGLQHKSCYLHLTGESYPRQQFAIPSHGASLTGRVCIPSREDGNPDGVSELNAYIYWQYYKMKTFNHDTHGPRWREEGRDKAINKKYSNENHNCSLFANRFLVASCINQDLKTATDWNPLTIFYRSLSVSIRTPGWFISRARRVRDEVLEKLVKGGRRPIYGLYLEEGVTSQTERTCYTYQSNWKDGKAESLPERFRDSISVKDSEDSGEGKSENPYEGMDPREKSKRGNEAIKAFHRHKWEGDGSEASSSDSPVRTPKSRPGGVHLPRGFESSELDVKALELEFQAHGL